MRLYHCKKEIVILTRELLFEFQMRFPDVFSTFLKHSLTKECMGSTLAMHYLAPCYCVFEALPDQLNVFRKHSLTKNVGAH